jgi:hypothetical protein
MQSSSWLAVLLVMVSTAAAAADAPYDLDLSPGPRLVGTRADSSGGGSGSVAVNGDRLTLDGSFHGLSGKPTAAHILAGPAPGVRGPVIGDLALTLSGVDAGTFHAEVRLNAAQQALLHNGGLYVEIDSGAAPEGDLWGWIMPQ